jgi:hypothetical protein
MEIGIGLYCGGRFETKNESGTCASSNFYAKYSNVLAINVKDKKK